LVGSSPTGERTIGPRIYGAGGNSPYPDNTWRTINGGGSVSFYSWGFWSTTAIRLEGYDNYHSVIVRVGPYQAEERWSGFGQITYYRQWWGAYVQITNTVHLCAIGAPCDSRTWILVK